MSSNKYYKVDTNKIIPFIVGPTAVGKTSVGIELAKRWKGEIISVDSRQIYKKLDIGTAKPTEEQQKLVNHYLIDVKDPGERISAGEYRNMAIDRVEKLLSKDKLPIFVGGSGMYVRAVTQGFFQGSRTDEKIRTEVQKELEKKGKEEMHARLEEIDPEYAEKIHMNDTKRVTRALEIYRMKGKPPTKLYKEQKENPPFPFVVFGLKMDRDKLYKRINQRVYEMIDMGLVEEVEKLRKQGYIETFKRIKTIGYYEVNQFLEGKITKKEAIENIKQNSRNLAKRQISWFKNQTDTNWINIDNKSQNEIIEQIEKKYRGENESPPN